jgi:hypothetical protein
MKTSMIAFLLTAGYLEPAFAEDCDKDSLRFGTLISIGADECNNAILRARAHAIGQSHTTGHCSEIQVAAASPQHLRQIDLEAIRDRIIRVEQDQDANWKADYWAFVENKVTRRRRNAAEQGPL